MARMHARRKGKSHSTRPPVLARPDWVKMDREEIEKLILDMTREGKSLSEIGMILRDQYGIPTVRQVLGKKLLRFLEEKGVPPEIPEDLRNLLERAQRLREHLRVHRKDWKNKHALELIEAKIHRLAKYYKRVGRLPQDWKYSTAVAKIE